MTYLSCGCPADKSLKEDTHNLRLCLMCLMCLLEPYLALHDASKAAVLHAMLTDPAGDPAAHSCQLLMTDSK